MEQQVRIGDKILLTIKRMGINGEGIGYYKRQAVFVDGALPQEEVEVEITKALNGYAYGEVTKFKKTSPDRITPRCPYYGKCGGCQLQHLKYESQLIQKQEMVMEAFDRYFDGEKEEILVSETIGMDNPWCYRNKTQLPVRHDGEKVVCGMYALNSNKLVYIDKCLIEEELISKTMKEVLDYLTKANISVYNPRFREGNLRYVVLRGFKETKEVQATFVLTREDKKLINVITNLDKKIDAIKSVYYSINNDPKSIEIITEKCYFLSGKEKISGKLGKLDFEISPSSFFQLNTTQMVKLYDEVKCLASLTGRETVLDLYCGIGSIGMYLADSCEKVYGVDNNPSNINNAKEFAKLNKIDNIEFYCGNIMTFLERLAKEGALPDVLIMDPPRRGVELTILNYLQKAKIKKIIYVSCNPSTLVKNINHLQKAYKVTNVEPLDMFPETANIECIAGLDLKK